MVFGCMFVRSDCHPLGRRPSACCSELALGECNWIKSREEQSQKIARRTSITDYQVSLFRLTIILLFFLKEKEPQSSVDDLITEQHDDNEKLVDDLGNDEIDDDLDENDNHEDAPIVTDQLSESIPSNIYDPQIWNSLDPKWIDLLAEKSPARDLSIEKGPKDQFNRRFNTTFYTRYLSNREKYDRDWLVYSKDVNKVFCFCCKLFKKLPLKGQLANEGYKDWTHFNVRLK
ncbi:uncharacterized protein [Malus domestica]|uniref:uncharacterized protein n=1 Tax=Malus domestica TaxID=3750 RepID=UPI0039764829